MWNDSFIPHLITTPAGSTYQWQTQRTTRTRDNSKNEKAETESKVSLRKPKQTKTRITMKFQPPKAIAKSCCCYSVAQSCPVLCDLKDCCTPGFLVLQYLLELVKTQVHWVSGAIQLSHSLLSHSPPTFNLSQHYGLFKWVSSSHQVANVLELQLQHQSFQWVFRTDFL